MTDISIKVRSDSGLNCFKLPEVQIRSLCSRAAGASVNVATVSHLCPHGQGTHTECVGHLTLTKVSVFDSGPDGVAMIPPAPFLRAALVTIQPEHLTRPLDLSSVPKDLFHLDAVAFHSCPQPCITKDALEKALHPFREAELQAVIIRTLPNRPEKLARNYDAVDPALVPYLSLDAAYYLSYEVGAKHVLVDLPSLDPMQDGGALYAHKIFFQWTRDRQALDGRDVNLGEAWHDCLMRSVTELCYIHDDVRDGLYDLNLQLSPIEGIDAVPSRPMLIRLNT